MPHSGGMETPVKEKRKSHAPQEGGWIALTAAHRALISLLAQQFVDEYFQLAGADVSNVNANKGNENVQPE